MTSHDVPRLRQDSNRGWWICNPRSDWRNNKPDINLQTGTSNAYRSPYLPELIEDEMIDRRLAFDPGLKRIAEAWPLLNVNSQQMILQIIDRLE